MSKNTVFSAILQAVFVWAHTMRPPMTPQYGLATKDAAPHKISQDETFARDDGIPAPAQGTAAETKRFPPLFLLC